MLTGMSEQDWDVALECSGGALPARGQRARRRKFLEAIHDFTVHNITWRALPKDFGKWNSVWKRFSRLSQAGMFEAFFQKLAEHSPTAHLVQMFDTTVVRAPSRRRMQRGAVLPGARALQGPLLHQIHLKTDLAGQPLVFELTGGEASDSPQFSILLNAGPDIRPRAAMGDKGYAAKANRLAARARGVCLMIPYRSNTKVKLAFFPRTLYKGRARIEQTMGKLKRFTRIALRCEKEVTNYASFVAFACDLSLVKTVLPPRCLVPGCRGISQAEAEPLRGAVWARFYTAAPRQRTLSEQRYSDRKLRSRNSPPSMD